MSKLDVILYYTLSLAQAFKGAATGLANEIGLRLRPLDSFEPEPLQQPPYWQDLLFANGRLDKLLDRLSHLPEVHPIGQKFALWDSEGGFRVTPRMRELVRYGVNDKQLIVATNSIANRMRRLSNHQETPVLIVEKWAPARWENQDRMTPEGLAFSYDDMVFSAKFTLEAIYPPGKADEIVRAICEWLIEDVSPAIPNILPGYSIGRDEQGRIVATPGQDRSVDLYENYLEGYKGATPDSQKTSQNNPPGPAAK